MTPTYSPEQVSTIGCMDAWAKDELLLTWTLLGAEIARLQAQVDALAGALLEQKRADAYTVAYRHLPEAAEQIAEAQEGAIRMREAALAAVGR